MKRDRFDQYVQVERTLRQANCLQKFRYSTLGRKIVSRIG